jgi:DNA invertase Pin-like site-specific DNA recombinase
MRIRHRLVQGENRRARHPLRFHAKPFEAWLMGDRWAVGPIKAGKNLDIIKSLKEQGRSVREIAKRTGLSKSTVQRKLNDHPADD